MVEDKKEARLRKQIEDIKLQLEEVEREKEEMRLAEEDKRRMMALAEKAAQEDIENARDIARRADSEMTVKDYLRDISAKLESDPKSKKWKMPMKGRLNNRKASQGYVTIIHIKDNKQVEFLKVPVDEQTATVDGCPRIVSPEDILYYKKRPIVIIPSWSVKPFSATENYNAAQKEGYMSKGYRLLLNQMKKQVIEAKKSMSMGLVWGIIIFVIAGGFFAYKAGLFS